MVGGVNAAASSAESIYLTQKFCDALSPSDGLGAPARTLVPWCAAGGILRGDVFVWLATFTDASQAVITTQVP